MKGNCGECVRRWYCETNPDDCDEWTDHVPMTNADRIRAMTDEELAWELMTWRLEAVARHHGVESQYPDTQQTILSWLQQPVKEMSDDLAYYTACNLHPGCSIGQFDPGRAEG